MSAEELSEARTNVSVDNEIHGAYAWHAGNANSYLISRRKRALDLLFAVAGLVIMLVLIVPVSIVVVASSGFPVFYRRDRLGLYGRKFVMVKFKTMSRSKNDDINRLRTAKDDPRISKVGRILRKTYVDELPQFWNVFKGEMSAVGPRPEFPELAVELRQIRTQFPKRLLGKPGVTGLAQIRYVYSHDNAHAAGRLPYDLEYLKKASVRYDLWIVWRTIAKALKFGGT